MIQVVTVYITLFFFSSRRRHTRCALVTGVQTCALPIWLRLATHLHGHDAVGADRAALRAGRDLDTRPQRITAGRDDPALAVPLETTVARVRERAVRHLHLEEDATVDLDTERVSVMHQITCLEYFFCGTHHPASPR